MEDLFASTFSRLPYANPLMMINRSETRATTRLLQCRGMGIQMNDIAPKFEGPGAVQRATDLDSGAFYARKGVLEQAAKWCEENAGKGEEVDEWTPILYRYEVVKTSAKKERDWGDVVFIDPTTTCFLLVMIYPNTCNCGNFAHHDYDAMTKYQANRLMSLVKYLYHKEGQVEWIRATHTTPQLGFKINPDLFLAPGKPLTPTNTKRFPAILHLTPSDWAPSLYATELDKIDNVIARSSYEEARPPELRASVMGEKTTARPDVSEVWKHRTPRQCAWCDKESEKDLMICSRCKLARYCSGECQKAHWPQHKVLCKKASATS